MSLYEQHYIDYHTQLQEKGYCVIPNILSPEEIDIATTLFIKWQQTIPNHNTLHSKINPHGIYKFHQIGHQAHSWYLRTRPQIINIFQKLWNTNDLIVSYDSTCFIDKSIKTRDRIWTHTDQAPNKKGLHCYQGFVSLTENYHKTLVVYEKSHLYHEQYFKDRNIQSNKDWQLIDHDTLHTLHSQKRTLYVPAGSLVLWDSRTFHQNQYGSSINNQESRIVQYLCYLPRNHPKNTPANQKKRQIYFDTLRTTSHWPCPIKVNGLQPRTYGDSSLLIDYTQLPKPDLTPYQKDINKLI
jgi:hypothetical protein